MIALAGKRSRLHLVAGARSSPSAPSLRPARTPPWQAMRAADVLQPLLERQRPPQFGELVGEVLNAGLTRPLAQQRRHFAHEHRAGAEGFDDEAELASSSPPPARD